MEARVSSVHGDRGVSDRDDCSGLREDPGSGALGEVAEWLLSGSPTPPPRSVKTAMVEALFRASGAGKFFETGTYEGDTTAAVAHTGAEVVTIELSEQLHAEAAARFIGYGNVRCVRGDSGKMLPVFLSQLNERAVFYLDAHYSAGKTAMGDKITPLAEELFHIFQHGRKDHVVLINDARSLDGIRYPSAALIEAMAKLYWPDSTVDVMHDILRIRPASPPP